MRLAGDGLSAEAFGGAPAPSLPFLSTPLRQAEHDIRAALRARAALILLSGLDGVGKTTLSLTLAAALAEEGWRVARWDGEDGRAAAAPSAGDLIMTACEEAGVALPRALGAGSDGRGSGRRWRNFGRARALAVIVDDADALPDDTLAGLARIGAEAAAEAPGCCVLVVGSLLLGDRLRRLAAAVTPAVAPVEVVMLPLPASEIEAYLHHRLNQAGAIDLRLFTFDAIAQIATHTKGVPQQINRLCLTVLERTRIDRGERISGVTIDEAAAACPPGPQVMVDDTGGFHIVAVDSLEPAEAAGFSDVVAGAPDLWPEDQPAAAEPRLEEPIAASPAPTIIDAEPVVVSARVHRMMAAAEPAVPHLAVPAPPAAPQRKLDWLRPALAGAAVAVLAIDLSLIALYGIDRSRLDGLGARLDATWSRLVTKAPAATAPAAATGGTAASAAPGDDAQMLLSRGERLLALGDHQAARLVLEHAAAKGSAAAALLLARSYDPMFIARAGIDGLRPEPELAAAWYRKAEELQHRATDTAAPQPAGRQQGGSREAAARPPGA